MVDRNLSCFLCREMIYEFKMEQLDSRRKRAVDLHLASCIDCSHVRTGIDSSDEYLRRLSETKMSIQALQSLKEKTRLTTLGGRWRRLPESLKWGTEALLAALVVAAGFHYGKQWISESSREPNKQVVLAEIDAAQPLPGEAGVTDLPEDKLAGAEPDEPDDIDMHGPTDDAMDGPSMAVEEPEATEPEPVEPEKVAKKEEPVEEPEPVAAAPAFKVIVASNYKAPKLPLVLAPPPPPTTAAVATAPAPVTSSTTPVHVEGFVFRLAMSMLEVDKAVPSFVSKISELGGEKAGQVQLGWKKSGGSYFHFTMPEGNYDSLMKHLRSFAQVRGSKDPHKRVMPAGTIRVILWVEELGSSPAPESAAESGSSAPPDEEEGSQPTESVEPSENAEDAAAPVENTAPVVSDPEEHE